MYIEFDKGEKFTRDKNADISDNLDTFQDAGYILEDVDLVIDIDCLDKEVIKKMLVTFNINTQYVWTDRGIHLYYKKPSMFKASNGISALGFPIEYKHNKNTNAVTIKRNGIEREIVNQGIREDLPLIFQYNKGYENLLGLNDGEGRNNKLYSHKMMLGNKDGWQSILSFINNYIFSEPLPSKEFEQVTRYEAIPEGKSGNEYRIAEYIINKLDYLNFGVRYYFIDERTGQYSCDEELLKGIVYDIAGEVKTHYIDEVIRQMKYRCKIVDIDTVFKIKLKNGYLDSGKFYPINYKGFTPYYLDIEYKEDAKPIKIVDDYINHLTNNDKDYRDLLLEVLGHTLIVDSEFKRLLAKFFIFVGSGGNGKGTLLQIIKGILGSENCTGLGIKELSNERYLPSFKGKLANLGDDIQDNSITDKDMKVLKNISTCDYMGIRELYKESEQIQFTGTLIFTSNHLIKSFEKGESYKRRVMWLPMYTKVDEKNKDPLFITKLTTKESVEYWLKLMVEGYSRLYKNNRFTQSKIVNDFNEDYHKENNPALVFLENYEPENFIDVPLVDGYDRYEEWCEDNAENYNKNMLRTALEEKWNIVTTEKTMNINKMGKTRVFSYAKNKN